MRARFQGVARAALTVMLSLVPLASRAQNTPRRQPQFTTRGTESCLVCHSGDNVQAVRQGPHGEQEGSTTPMNGKGCESCHGPGSFHVSRAFGGAGFPPVIRFGQAKDASPRETQIEACLSCHREAVEHRKATPFVGSPHDNLGLSCSSCHVAHAVQDPMTNRETQVEFCYRCHGNKRTGHYRFEGKPAPACSTCHDVHEVRSD